MYMGPLEGEPLNPGSQEDDPSRRTLLDIPLILDAKLLQNFIPTHALRLFDRGRENANSIPKQFLPAIIVLIKAS